MIIFLDVETTGQLCSRNASWREVANWPRIVSINWALYRENGEQKLQQDSMPET